ncbi:hypothetical protein Tco_0685509 [Tanacetum coccineum]
MSWDSGAALLVGLGFEGTFSLGVSNVGPVLRVKEDPMLKPNDVHVSKSSSSLPGVASVILVQPSDI